MSPSVKRPAGFLGVVGVVWLFYSLAFALAMASLVGGTPAIVNAEDVLYVAGLIGGPLALIAGSVLLLRSPSRIGAVLAALACLDLTGWAAFNILSGHLQSLTPSLFAFYFGPLAVSLAADIAAWRIWREVFQR